MSGQRVAFVIFAVILAGLAFVPAAAANYSMPHLIAAGLGIACGVVFGAAVLVPAMREGSNAPRANGVPIFIGIAGAVGMGISSVLRALELTDLVGVLLVYGFSLLAAAVLVTAIDRKAMESASRVRDAKRRE